MNRLARHSLSHCWAHWPWRLGLLGLAPTCLILLLATPAMAQQGNSGAPVAGDNEVVEAVITRAVAEELVDLYNGEQQLLQTLEVELVSGDRAGETLTIENGQWASVAVIRYEVGDRVVLGVSGDASGEPVYYITDYVRRAPMLWLFGLFVVVSIAVGRRRGAASLVGMAVSFFVIFVFVLPQINAGRDPIAVAIMAAALLIPVTFSLSHGWSWKTAAAVAGTLVSLVLTGLLARVAVDATRLTGYASEDVYFLQAASPGQINVRGLLMASIVIGLLGILDDITISQAAIVQQMRRALPEAPLLEVYRRAMDVGRDHIASLVNTLVLVYASSAMPLLLLFTRDELPFRQAINYEVVAEEVVRILVASTGLIAAVPITTALACWLVGRSAFSDADDDDGFVHHGHAH